MVELWLAKEQFQNYEIDLIQYGLKICWRNDYRSLKTCSLSKVTEQEKTSSLTVF